MSPKLSGGSELVNPAALTPSTASARASARCQKRSDDAVLVASRDGSERPSPTTPRGSKPGVDLLEAKEAVGQQSGTEEQREGESKFGDDECATDGVRAATRAAAGRRGKEAGGRRRTTREDGGERSETDQDPAQQRHRCGEGDARGRRERPRRDGEDRERPGRRDRVSLAARARPTAPARIVSTTHSVRIRRAMRWRSAPSAMRTANSCSRADARTSMRVATFAMASSSTNATAPAKSPTWRPAVPMMASRSGWGARRAPLSWKPAAQSGKMRTLMSSRSRAACSSVTPSLSRATPL